MIAVLPADCPDNALSSLLARLEGRGWRTDVSRGEEQTLVAIAGAPSLEEVRALLPEDQDADLFELLSAREYRLERRLRLSLRWLVWALLVLVGIGGVFTVLGFLHPPAEDPYGGEFVDGGALASLSADQPRLVRVEDLPVLVGRGEGSRLFALGATCTHLDDCLLEWNEERRQLQCPCHGCLFDTYGNVLRGPAAIPLRSYDVDLLGGEILVRR